MIINDENRFAFIHIPKCAGSTVRKKLEKFDQRDGQFSARVAGHPQLGQVDYTHIPLFTLRQYFSEEYEKLRLYKTFAVMRDPYARFPSSVAQHLNKYGPRPLHALSSNQALAEVLRIIEYLNKKEASGVRQLPPEYIHFQKQVDYIYDQEECLITTLYTPSRLGQLFKDVSEQVGQDILCSDDGGVKKVNQSVIYRNTGTRVVVESIRRAVGPIWRNLLPVKCRGIAKDILTVPAKKKHGNEIFKNSQVSKFIEEYYKDDIGILNNICAEP